MTNSTSLRLLDMYVLSILNCVILLLRLKIGTQEVGTALFQSAECSGLKEQNVVIATLMLLETGEEEKQEDETKGKENFYAPGHFVE
jgi:hypothetical protein